ncbi:hypothetical protein UPYG_G00005440 [Umbra pygmaea]|uniref:Peptidase A1 domain-containing protein n=1 Tax=Umbra pygmaea TaxID=75934 RepID=A0ABD0XHB7_UMBPY
MPSSNRDSASGSVLTFGGIESNYYTGHITWIPLSSKTVWLVKMNSVNIGDNIVACKESCQAIFDTGTSLIIGPLNDTNTINKKIGATYQNGDFIVNCSSIPNLPSIGFTLNGSNFIIPASAYILQVSSVCISGFQSSGSNENVWILGDVFIRQFYSVFNRQNNTIGLAPISSTLASTLAGASGIFTASPKLIIFLLIFLVTNLISSEDDLVQFF